MVSTNRHSNDVAMHPELSSQSLPAGPPDGRDVDRHGRSAGRRELHGLVHRFEEAFANYVGAPFAIALNSCTAALHLSLLAAGIGPGDDVVTTPLTFCATANTIVHAGATPVFADVDLATMNLDATAAAAAVTRRTRALMVVHFTGRPADSIAFSRLASERRLVLIEDAAHAVEAVSRSGKVGSTADFTCFSFSALKDRTTAGGGVVTTMSPDRAEFLRIASLHGLRRDDLLMPGFKYNMTDIQAGQGLDQLASLDAELQRREAIWDRYIDGLRHLPLTLPAEPSPSTLHARSRFTVLIDPALCGRSRDDVHEALRARGIVSGVGFRALHLHSYYAERFNLHRGLFPNAEFISDRALALPLSAATTDRDVDAVIGVLADLLA
jgi:dTDP-4-amino-4,6-dideoxygalactose transaminase